MSWGLKEKRVCEDSQNILFSFFSEDLSDELKKTLQERLPVDPVVEFRPVDPEEMYRLKPLPPKRLTWVKILEKLGKNSANYFKKV